MRYLECQSAIGTGNNDTRDVQKHHAARPEVKGESTIGLITHVRVIELVSEPNATFLALGMFARTQVVSGEFFSIERFTPAYITSNARMGFFDVLRIPISDFTLTLK